MDYREIGLKVRSFRKSRGLSQEQLAERVGISTTHMSHIETGATKLSLPVLVALAKALEVRTDELLFPSLPKAGNDAREKILAVLDTCTEDEADLLSALLQAARQTIGSYTIKK